MLADRQGRREQLAIKVEERFLLVQADEVVHASVEDDQIRVVTNSLSGTSNYRTLDELQTRLDPAVFWRVHRSHLVNINKIKEIVPWFSRNYILKMKDAKGTEIPVSRSQTQAAAGIPEAMSDSHNDDPFAAPPSAHAVRRRRRRSSRRRSPGRAPPRPAPPDARCASDRRGRADAARAGSRSTARRCG